MRCLKRNKVPFWYCLFDHKEELLDEDGNKTGEFVVYYHKPVLLLGNVSVARGEVQDELFGKSISYDKVILLEDPNCPINEDTVLFVDKEPEFSPKDELLFDNNGHPILDSHGEPLYATILHPLFDYIVRRAGRSLNSAAYAIERVTVT